jgi:DNA-directed RNA polymerase alpha subunit
MWSASMPDNPLPDLPIDIAILIKDAQAARVAAHLQVVLSRVKSHVNPSSNRKVEQMRKGIFEDCEGPIRGLRLPLDAWNALHREGVTTIDQLRAMADKIHTLPGIGAKTALAIRAELGRLALLEAQSS